LLLWPLWLKLLHPQPLLFQQRLLQRPHPQPLRLLLPPLPNLQRMHLKPPKKPLKRKSPRQKRRPPDFSDFDKKPCNAGLFFAQCDPNLGENTDVAIPQSFIQELLSRVDVVEVVGRFVQLKKGGANFMGLCPFHGEKSPSFTVSPTKQFFH
jgi:hypothetical protein